jgi:translation initiation factor 3 subunit A
MDTESLRRWHIIQLEKEKGELSERLRVTGKRIDHFERALRREEIPLLDKDYESQLATELRTYEENRQQKLSDAAARHQESVRLKKRLSRILPDYVTYRSVVKERRSEEFRRREQEAHEALESEKSKRRAAFQRHQEEERRRAEELRRQEELELERKRKEEAERQAREEAAQKEAAEKAKAREEQQRFVILYHFIDFLQKRSRNYREATTAGERGRRELRSTETAASHYTRRSPWLKIVSKCMASFEPPCGRR